MKYLFIVNPKSGKGKGADFILPKIKDAVAKHNIDAEIYISKSVQDARDRAKSEAAKGEPVRVYACGGDGTIFDIVNSIYGHENAEFAAIPLGSGNDFIRLFGTKEEFLDVDAQIDGTAISIDVIKCGDNIAVNQCSMGFDAEVCSKQSEFKKLSFFTGETAYTASLVYCAAGKHKNKFTISIDDGEPINDSFCFAFCGNSRYYGGGYFSGPFALPDDGLLDFSIVRAMSLPKLLSRIGEYKRGEHLSWPETTYLRGRKMTIHSDSLAAVNIDGECEKVHDCTMELVPNAMKFVIPTTSSYVEDRASGKINNIIKI